MMIDTILENVLAICVGGFILIFAGLVAALVIGLMRFIGQAGVWGIAFLLAAWSIGQIAKSMAGRNIDRKWKGNVK